MDQFILDVVLLDILFSERDAYILWCCINNFVDYYYFSVHCFLFSLYIK